ncbi:MAG: hypothetical protein LW832_10555 [Parachlamydia sp.]|jgi:hypothetical protein|nr:hypothetical protein [Parachlamydia sp.]
MLSLLSFQDLSVYELSKKGVYAGAAIAVVPFVASTLISGSKAILINVVANMALSFLTGATIRIRIHDIEWYDTPLLWEISFVSAIVGTSIAAFSFSVGVINEIYKRCMN